MNILESEEDDSAYPCVFCPKLRNFAETSTMLNKALYLKYSSSQNYYYSKEMNELLDNEKKQSVICFKYKSAYEAEDENFTNCYTIEETENKLIYLTEYYKYHKEVPRLFMRPAAKTVNLYHDKKRRIEYFKIKKMLKTQRKELVSDEKEVKLTTEEISHSRDSGTSSRIPTEKLQKILTGIENESNRYFSELPSKIIQTSEELSTLYELNILLGGDEIDLKKEKRGKELVIPILNFQKKKELNLELNDFQKNNKIKNKLSNDWKNMVPVLTPKEINNIKGLLAIQKASAESIRINTEKNFPRPENGHRRIFSTGQVPSNKEAKLSSMASPKKIKNMKSLTSMIKEVYEKNIQIQISKSSSKNKNLKKELIKEKSSISEERYNSESEKDRNLVIQIKNNNLNQVIIGKKESTLLIKKSLSKSLKNPSLSLLKKSLNSTSNKTKTLSSSTSCKNANVSNNKKTSLLEGKNNFEKPKTMINIRNNFDNSNEKRIKSESHENFENFYPKAQLSNKKFAKKKLEINFSSKNLKKHLTSAKKSCEFNGKIKNGSSSNIKFDKESNDLKIKEMGSFKMLTTHQNNGKTINLGRNKREEGNQSHKNQRSLFDFKKIKPQSQQIDMDNMRRKWTEVIKIIINYFFCFFIDLKVFHF